MGSLAAPIAFKAPWSRSLGLRTVSISILFVIAGCVGFLLSVHTSLVWQLALIGFPVAAWIASVLTAVRGYSLSEDEIVVRSWASRKRLPLGRLRSVQGAAEAMNGSLCVLANCG